MQLNQHYKNLEDSYLFASIEEKVSAFRRSNPQAEIIRMGIGDVTLPLCEAVTTAMKQACDEMGHKESFRGYAPYPGYEFLREAVCAYYAERQIQLPNREIFISDGAKGDIGNILDIFGQDNVVLIPDPVYPVYVDTNIMDGRKIQYLNAQEENGFLPLPEEGMKADLIYLCSPNNPTGAVYSKAQLKVWVDYALDCDAVILFDAAYEAFIRDEHLPRSIFEIPGAERCAIEFCSLSKTAGFTGTRCGYTIIPEGLQRQGVSLNSLWLRRQSTKYNGVPYIIQRGAEAVFSPEGRKQTGENIRYYLENASIIGEALRKNNIWFTGGDNSPYIWLKCPDGLTSWQYFDRLLADYHIVGTPGSGFGRNGEGFLRLTAFGERDQVRQAVQRLLG